MTPARSEAGASVVVAMAAVLLVFATTIQTGEKRSISFVTSHEVREKLLVYPPVGRVRLELGGNRHQSGNLVPAANSQRHQGMQSCPANGRHAGLPDAVHRAIEDVREDLAPQIRR